MAKPDETELDFEELEPIELEITDVLDLHSFPPSDVKALVREYLDLAYDKGLRQLRIIHGKGTGTQRRMVRAILERDPRVRRVVGVAHDGSLGAPRAPAHHARQRAGRAARRPM